MMKREPDLSPLGIVAGVVLAMSAALAHAQTLPPPAPTSYSFTFAPAAVDALYAALERSSRVQELVTGDRSPKMDALEQQIRAGVAEQKAALAKAAADAAEAAAAKADAADKPKDEAKP